MISAMLEWLISNFLQFTNGSGRTWNCNFINYMRFSFLPGSFVVFRCGCDPQISKVNFFATSAHLLLGRAEREYPVFIKFCVCHWSIHKAIYHCHRTKIFVNASIVDIIIFSKHSLLHHISYFKLSHVNGTLCVDASFSQSWKLNQDKEGIFSSNSALSASVLHFSCRSFVYIARAIWIWTR